MDGDGGDDDGNGASLRFVFVAAWRLGAVRRNDVDRRVRLSL